MPRISLRDIAEASGYSVATVSNALRGTGDVAAPTRQKISALAESMGYRPNPLISSLATGRFRQHDAYSSLPLAVVYSEKPDLKDDVVEHALKLGYELHPVKVDEATDWPGLLTEWFHTGVAGVIFSRVTTRVDFSLPEWSQFSVVATGGFLPDYPGSRVTRDFFTEINQALDRVQAAGYRRILCAHGKHQYDIADDAMRESAALHWALRQRHAGVEFETWVGEIHDHDSLVERIEAWQPDVLVGLLTHFYSWLAESSSYQNRPIAFAGLSLAKEAAHTMGLSGFIDGSQSVSMAALRLLDDLVRHRERGFTDRPVTVLIRSEWHEGSTLPVVQASSST